MASSILPMSHLIANDILVSPDSDSPSPWSNTTPAPGAQADSLFTNYSSIDYTQYSSAAASPQPDSPPTHQPQLLRSRYSPDTSSSEHEQLCMPTHQLFDLPPTRSPSPHDYEETISSSPGHSGVKRSGLSTTTRKPRERISTKDFIPPDVSGLSKREARLVKNRAAAFLSRQRKREEFETMEVRVAELEQENARLMAFARGESDPAAELEQLRAQLAAAEQRSNELVAQLAQRQEPSLVKMESFEQELPPSSNPSSRASPSPELGVQLGHKSGTSIGLMVLLCALPSMLSLPTQQSAVPTTFSVPIPSSSLGSFGSSHFDINTLISSEDRDWSLSNGMDLDFDVASGSSPSVVFPSSSQGKLELGNHNALDISFDAISMEDGKIRVRIHPPSSAPSSAASSLASTPATSFTTPGFLKTEQEDPFLGVGHFDHHGFSSDPMQSAYDLDQDILNGMGSRKRVRIALKNMPSEGTEGGEWEVQVC